MRCSWIPLSATADSRRLIVSRALRGFADGLVSILLPSYLTALGLSATQIGIILFGTLFCSAMLTLWAGFAAHRFGCRRLLLGACVLMLATGLLFSYLQSFWPLLVVAFIGTLNPSAGDVSLFLPLEQATLAGTVTTRDLTRIFAMYNVAGALAGAFGALFSGLPTFVAARLDLSTTEAQRCAFIVYSVFALIAALMYRSLSVQREADEAPIHGSPLEKSRGIVMHLAALFSLDALAGGFIVQSLLALFFHLRFGVPLALLAALFFGANACSALSYLAAAWLARRFGLLNTMVFTHLPSNILLMLVALMPSFPLAAAVLLLRQVLSQMDVPTRQAYTMTLVAPEERTAAASVTSLGRSAGSASSPVLAGLLLQSAPLILGLPLLIAGALKAGYDLTLWAIFRRVRLDDQP